MKKESKEKNLKKILKKIDDIHLICVYCLIYEEMKKRKFIESSFKI